MSNHWCRGQSNGSAEGIAIRGGFIRLSSEGKGTAAILKEYGIATVVYVDHVFQTALNENLAG